MKMTIEEKKRLHTIGSKTVLVLGIGIAYVCFATVTGWGIPCVFRLITGLDCPGCGISRMFLSLLKLDFTAAARYNLLVLCLLPFAMALFGYKTWQYVKTGKTKMGSVEKLFYIVAFVFCITFGVLRNMDCIPLLTMP